MRSDKAPLDYPDPLEEPDPFDPTGYYARKAARNAEMLPYLGWLFVASLAIVAVALLMEIAMITTTVLIAFGAGLVVGWNVLPQPAWVKNLYDRAKAKLTG